MLAKIQNIYKRKRRNDRNRLALIFSFPIILLLKEGNFDYFCPKLILFPKLIACAIMIATTAKTINVAICLYLSFKLITFELFVRCKGTAIYCVRKQNAFISLKKGYIVDTHQHQHLLRLTHINLITLRLKLIYLKKGSFSWHNLII